VTPERVRENFDLFDFELSEDDMAAIARLNRDERTGPDPSTFVAP
jgi:2,5-diketo-D-gluconate reductase A